MLCSWLFWIVVVRRSHLWFASNRLYFRDRGGDVWASLAAFLPVYPALFVRERVHLLSTREHLRRGRLVVEPGTRVPIKVVRDLGRFVSVRQAASG